MNIYPTHYIYGPQEARATIIMYYDFQCLNCAWWYPRVKEIVEDFSGQVQLILRPYILPSHPLAYQATKAALAAGAQNKYYEMISVLFEHIGLLEESRYPDYAREVGMDVQQFQRDYRYNAIQWKEQIKHDIQTGKEYEVDGTPCFFINGQKVHPINAPEFKKMLQEFLLGHAIH